MNSDERKMLSLLKEGKEKYFFAGIKAEFEAEGTRMDEMLRLSEITRKAGLNLGIKIGGCEAVSDLYTTKLIGCEYIIAPMVETPYALSKYIEAKNKVYCEDERQDVRFLFNIETITAFNNLDKLIEVANIKNGADGMVFGRTDFTGSCGLPKEEISSPKIADYINKTAAACKKHNLDFIIGGGIAKETIDPIIVTKEIYLTRFETRKIIFNPEILSENRATIEKALEKALFFELLWLHNKQNYYHKMAKEDVARIQAIEKRF